MTESERITDSHLRPIMIQRQVLRHPAGSSLVSQGKTRVLCAASIGNDVPDFRSMTNGGWITAEYAMLPGSTTPRKRRDGAARFPDKRSIEISRFLGRCLRAVVDLDSMGPHLITLDCDVLDADGGTRAAALSGSCIALHDALVSLVNEGRIAANPFRTLVAGVSVVAVNDRLVLDPSYSDDARASMELNIALSETGAPVEIHAMGEGKPFSIRMLEEAIDIARGGAELIFEEQRRVLQETRADHP